MLHVYWNYPRERKARPVADPTETQSEWYTASNPDVLLNVVWERPLAYSSPMANGNLPVPLARRLRLFGVVCARMVWHLLPNDARNAVLLSERFADGRATQADLQAAAVRMTYRPITYQQQAISAAGWASAGHWEQPPVWNPAEASREAAKALATRAAGQSPPGDSPLAVKWQIAWNTAFIWARAQQAEFVRDIFSPPNLAVHALRLEREWLTSTVVTLARQADDTGEYGLLPILADALQDAGCDNEFILDRCRTESGLHCRGNWVVDLLLERE